MISLIVREVHTHGSKYSFYKAGPAACLTRQLLKNNRPIIMGRTRVHSERYSVLLLRPSVNSWSLTFTFDQLGQTAGAQPEPVT